MAKPGAATTAAAVGGNAAAVLAKQPNGSSSLVRGAADNAEDEAYLCDPTKSSGRGPGNGFASEDGAGCEGSKYVFAILAAGIMLGVNALLQRTALIDRYGQDPHDKTEPSWELLLENSPHAASQQVKELGYTLGPLVGLLLLWWWADGWLRRQQQFALDAATGKAHVCKADDPGANSSSSRSGTWGLAQELVCYLGMWTVGLQLLAIAGFWAAQLTGTGGYTAAEAVVLLLQQHVHFKAGVLTAAGLQLTDSYYWLKLLNGALGLPVRLLLPRLVYQSALGMMAAVAALEGVSLVHRACSKGSAGAGAKGLQLGWKHLRGVNGLQLEGDCRGEETEQQVSNGLKLAEGQGGEVARRIDARGGGQALEELDAEAVQLWRKARGWLWLVAALSGPVVMVLGYKGPMLLLLSMVQGLALLTLVQLQQSAGRQFEGHQQDEGKGGHAGQRQLTAAPGLWSMFALQLFFCSGHFCEFSGLQYTSSFIGYDEMEWYTSGGLLFLNTFGLSMLCWLALPLVVVVTEGVGAGVTAAAEDGIGLKGMVGALCNGQANAGQEYAKGGLLHEMNRSGGFSGTVKHNVTVEGKRLYRVGDRGESQNICTRRNAHGLLWGGSRRPEAQITQLSGAVLLSNSMRLAAVCVCLLSAAVQQQHILLWAIFAPKLVFEVMLMALADACHVLVGLFWGVC
jgi:hypothetical protein